MRIFVISISVIGCLLLVPFVASATSPIITYDHYDYMAFSRAGGGAISYLIYPTANRNELRILITSYRFGDVSVDTTITPNNVANNVAFRLLRKALDGKIRVTGNYRAPGGLTGTWASVSLMNGNESIEVTNGALRRQLAKFESVVNSFVPSTSP